MSLQLPDPLPPNVNRALPALEIYMWVGCAIATIVVAIRLTARVALKQGGGWDDLFIAMAFICSIVLYVGTAVLLRHGYGRHIFYIAPNDLILLLKLNTVVTIAGFFTLAFARMSIGLFLLRLVARVATHSWIVYFGLILNIVQAVALIILTGLHCVPIEKTWDPTVPGFCIPTDKFTIADRALGCLNVVVDFVFALFPLLLLSQVQIQKKVRLAIYLLLSCGLLAGVCSIGRVVASDLTSQDITWDLVPLTYWALSETSGVLILACMPAMHQVWKHYYGVALTHRSRSRVTASKNISSNMSKETKDRTKDTDSRKDLIFSPGNIHMKKDVYIELTDRAPSREAGQRYFEDDRAPHHGTAHTATHVV